MQAIRGWVSTTLWKGLSGYLSGCSCGSSPWEYRTVLWVYGYNLKVTWIACRIARLSYCGLMIWCTPEPVGVFWARCTPSEGERINFIQRVFLVEAHHRNTGDVFGWRLVSVWMMVVVLGCSELRLTRAFHNVQRLLNMCRDSRKLLYLMVIIVGCSKRVYVAAIRVNYCQ